MSEAENTTPEVTKAPKFCVKSSEGKVCTFTFGNGTVLSIDLDTLSEEVQTELMIHGAMQKIGDSYASAGGDFAFGTACAEKVINNLQSGTFNAARTGSGVAKVGELAQALSELQGIDVATVEASLEAATDEVRKQFRAHPAVKAKIAEIRARKAAEALAKATPASLELPALT